MCPCPRGSGPSDRLCAWCGSPLAQCGPVSPELSAFRPAPEISYTLALQFNGQRPALAVGRLAGGEAHPALADAVFLDVGLLLALEAHAHAALQQRLVVEGAPGIGGEAVRRCVGHSCASVGLLKTPAERR